MWPSQNFQFGPKQKPSLAEDWQCPNKGCKNHSRCFFGSKPQCPICSATREAGDWTCSADWQCPNAECRNHHQLVCGSKDSCYLRGSRRPPPERTPSPVAAPAAAPAASSRRSKRNRREATYWIVIADHPVNVRSENDQGGQAVLELLTGHTVHGIERDGWIVLTDGSGYVTMHGFKDGKRLMQKHATIPDVAVPKMEPPPGEPPSDTTHGDRCAVEEEEEEELAQVLQKKRKAVELENFLEATELKQREAALVLRLAKFAYAPRTTGRGVSRNQSDSALPRRRRPRPPAGPPRV